MQQIGILTLAHNDTTQAFRRFRKGLRKYYREGIDISLHFRFAKDETELGSLASQLLLIPVDVMVTGGVNAFNAVYTRDNDTKIVHVGDTPPYVVPNIHSGYTLDASTMCNGQLDKLVRASSPRATVTVLVTDPRSLTNPMNNSLYASLVAHQTVTYPQLTLHPLTVTTRDQLHLLTSAQIRGNFMLIANGMFFDEAPFIANLVKGAAVNAIFPEREYKKAMGPNPANTWVRGHHIPSTFEKAADRVRDFLDDNPTQPIAPAPADVDPDALM
jgi:hypothetical protein